MVVKSKGIPPKSPKHSGLGVIAICPELCIVDLFYCKSTCRLNMQQSQVLVHGFNLLLVSFGWEGVTANHWLFCLNRVIPVNHGYSWSPSSNQHGTCNISCLERTCIFQTCMTSGFNMLIFQGFHFVFFMSVLRDDWLNLRLKKTKTPHWCLLTDIILFISCGLDWVMKVESLFGR